MKKSECKRIRKDLPKYLSGHLFKTSQKRIARHLQECVVCRSEFEALKHAEETRLLLKDISAPDDLVGRVKEGVSRLGQVKKLLYRPLWVAGLLLLAGGVYYYLVTPRQLEIEIERIQKTESTATTPVPTLPATTASPAPAKGTEPQQTEPATAAPPSPAPEPLAVSLTPVNDQAAVQTINDVLHRSGSLHTSAFTDTQKEITGSLTAKELMALFSGIEGAAKVSFNKKRFDSFPPDQAIPFVLRLKPAPRPAQTPAVPAAPQTPAPPSERTVSVPLPPQPGTALSPTVSP
ncbi:MAG TPA: hypothetical protein VK654_00550 [Nitrospirota bacterium]|nr:hypothetical protein [Nitrospirota bacterium]